MIIEIETTDELEEVLDKNVPCEYALLTEPCLNVAVWLAKALIPWPGTPWTLCDFCKTMYCIEYPYESKYLRFTRL